LSLGSWIAENKLAAGGIAAGGALLYLSRRGGMSGSNDPQGQLVPVAAAYDTSTDTSNTEQAQAAADSADQAATSAQQAQDAVDSINNGYYGDGGYGVGDGTTDPTTPPFVASPSPSSVPVAQAAPGPTVSPAPAPTVPPPAPTPTTYPLPGSYTAGWPFGQQPPNSGMLIGRVLGFQNVGGGSNSNGQYTTFRFFSDLGNTGDWNYYYSGAKKGEWVGPFNFPRSAPGG
jgi:hypothetical protein